MTEPIVQADTVADAFNRIRGHVRETPIVRIDSVEVGNGAPLTIKLEHLQHSGSFKARGAFNAMLVAPVPDVGVIAASGGNHGAAVAFAAARLGHRAEIFVPQTAPNVKVQRLLSYGAVVQKHGEVYAEALAASQERARITGAHVLHAYDQPEIVAGQGTAFAELSRQDPQLETILVAVGGGGLISGALAWYAGKARVVAVEPQGAPTLFRALEAGRTVDVETGGVAADALGARRAGTIAFEMARKQLYAKVLVTDDDIIAARRWLWEHLRIAAELGGATALAALLSGAYTPQRNERVGLLICGGNTDVGI